MLAREARLRQVLRGGARADRHRRPGAVLARKHPVGGDDLIGEPGRERGRFDQRAQAGAGGGQRRHVLAGDILQDGREPVPQPVTVEQGPVGGRGDREPVGHANAGRAELAVELAEGGGLAADPGDVPQPDLPEPLDEAGVTHDGAPRSG